MTDSRQSPLLEARDLKIQFRGTHGLLRAVDGVSFTIYPNEAVGIVGESGSGKTVLLLSLLGLLDDPNAIIEGSVRYKGQELIGLPQRALRRIRGKEIAMVFQDPMTALTPVYTIGWQLTEQICEHNRISRRGARRRAIQLLEDVGIPSPSTVADRYPHQLSGGMRQRAVIAMALSCDPSLLIADEPTTALDVTIQAQILDLLRRLRQDHASSIAIVTHDLGVVAEFADRILVMYAGGLVETGSTTDLFTAPLHPYTKGLLDSMPPLTGPRQRRLKSIPGNPPLITKMPPGCAFAPRCAFRFERCTEQRPELEDHDGHAAACFATETMRALADIDGQARSERPRQMSLTGKQGEVSTRTNRL